MSESQTLLSTDNDVALFLNAISFDKALGLFGEQARLPDVTPLYSNTLRFEGWRISWHYKKPSKGHNGKMFAFIIEVYLPWKVSAHRALELIFDKHMGFARHELQECFLYYGKSYYDPHESS